MRLEWIEDILAVAETGSLIRAADRRCLTQSAFSRRIRTIETQLGVELFDRTRKPVEPHAAVLGQAQEMRDLAIRLRRLAGALREPPQAQRRVVIASQHAITTAIAPPLIRRIAAAQDLGIRLRSANRDECYTMLLTRQAEIMMFYETDRQALAMESSFVERHLLGADRLVPVFSAQLLPELEAELARGELSVVSYPGDVFFGRVLRDDLWSRLDGLTLRPRAETALTLAALQLAATGVALAWVPETLARGQILAGQVVDLGARLGTQPLRLAMARLRTARSNDAEQVWQALLAGGLESESAPAAERR